MGPTSWIVKRDCYHNVYACLFRLHKSPFARIDAPQVIRREVENQLADLLVVLGQEEEKVGILSNRLAFIGHNPQDVLAEHGLDESGLVKGVMETVS